MKKPAPKTDRRTMTGHARIAVPLETQIALAAKRRELAIARYKTQFRRGRNWSDEPVESDQPGYCPCRSLGCRLDHSMSLAPPCLLAPQR